MGGLVVEGGQKLQIAVGLEILQPHLQMVAMAHLLHRDRATMVATVATFLIMEVVVEVVLVVQEVMAQHQQVAMAV
jgi:hypothetical protein